MTTEEDLLQEEYRGNRQSMQLHLGYRVYQQGGYWERGRGKVTRALSVGSPVFHFIRMHPFFGRKLVGMFDVASDG
jgi:hypothetical protein